MALLQVYYMSNALFRQVPLQVILPADKFSRNGGPAPQAPETFPTLYLLHGITGSCMGWTANTRLQRWAEERNIAVVLPSGDNSFYVDREGSHNFYGEFLGRELVDITRRMFPLSRRREDTWIGGLSMGGYGAVRNGLKYADTFGRIIAFSAALHLLEGYGAVEDLPFDNFENFGDRDLAKASDKNPRVLIDGLAASGAPLPKIYLSCGTEDALFDANRQYRDLFRAAGFDVTWFEGPGGHDWDFWDQQIHRALDWTLAQ